MLAPIAPMAIKGAIWIRESPTPSGRINTANCSPP
jgi:hypothetical protein